MFLGGSTILFAVGQLTGRGVRQKLAAFTRSAAGGSDPFKKLNAVIHELQPLFAMIVSAFTLYFEYIKLPQR